MQKFLIIIATLCSSLVVSAQNFRQFYFNPFIFSPAYSGSSGYTEIEVVHRNQWINFNSAPVTSGFNIQHPTKKRVSLGFNFLTHETVALRSSSALTSFAYRIPLTEKQLLSFGISAGIGLNNLELDGADYSNDPAVLNAAGNSWYADGNFGVLYSLGELQIGFALPKLFGYPYFNPQRFNSNRYSQFRNQLYSIRYKFQLGTNISLEPYFLYRLNRDNQNSWEAATLIHFKDKVSLGTSYHETQGVAFFFSMTIKERLRVGYGYELPPIAKEFGSLNSHEIHISMRISEYKALHQK